MRRIGKFIGCGLIAVSLQAKLYYGNYCCKTDFDLIRKIKAIVSN